MVFDVFSTISCPQISHMHIYKNTTKDPRQKFPEHLSVWAHRMVHRTIRSARPPSGLPSLRGDRSYHISDRIIRSVPGTIRSPLSGGTPELLTYPPDHPVCHLIYPVSRLWSETGVIVELTGPSGLLTGPSGRSPDRPVCLVFHCPNLSGVPGQVQTGPSGVHRMIRCARYSQPTGSPAALGI